jgi:tRNA dimethylallyltransferase
MDELINLSAKYNLITVLGATAGGKTAFAAQLAYLLDAEVIGADSRQLYRRMDIGTGKDYKDYDVFGKKIPIHLIDIIEPGEKYNVYQYQKDFVKVYRDITGREKKAVLCGGSGLYIESVLKDYKLFEVPINEELRHQLKQKSLEELILQLESYKRLHNTTDIDDRERLIRAIEIAEFESDKKNEILDFPEMKHLVLGIKFDRNSRRKRISERLKLRLENGLIEEVKGLIDSGVDMDTLIYYGLEYKYITLYLQGKMSFEEMFKQLETAIHQFSKRQMTWFRRMERNGTEINWIDGYMSMDEKIDRVLKILRALN